MTDILFLTDFSDVAKNAFVYALSVADKFKAEVHILHVTHIIESDDPDVQRRIHPFAQFYMDSVETDEKAELKSEAKKLEQLAISHGKAHVPVVFHFEKGYFRDAVEAYIDELGIDLLVMGTAGANTIDKKVFGSHTMNLIDQVSIPVLAIPAEARYTDTRHFAIAVMLRESELPVVERLEINVRNIAGDLRYVHIVDDASKVAVAEEKVKTWVAATEYPDISVDILVHTDVEAGLTDFIRANGTEVLGVIHRNLPYLQRLFKANHSKRLLQYAKTALLIYNIDE